MDLFTRSEKNPIITPNAEYAWEALKVYNPGAVFHKGEYHLFYRAVGIGDDWHSVLGRAVSTDGEFFRRFPRPILDRDSNNSFEYRGLEDPRITKIGDLFFMAYAAYDGEDVRLNIATSTDLVTWAKQGKAFLDFEFLKNGGDYLVFEHGKVIKKNETKIGKEWSKSGTIFPEKIDGKYWMLFGEYKIWLANSSDGMHWNVLPGVYLSSRGHSFFDNAFVEMGPPPIKTPQGWLVLYHGINDAIQYQLGVLLLDLNDLTKILYSVADRTPRVYPGLNETGGGILPIWNTVPPVMASIVFSITSCGSLNTAAGF